MKKMFPILSHH